MAAEHFHVDRSTWSCWEADGIVMGNADRERIARFIEMPAAQLSAVMRERWNAAHGKPTTPERVREKSTLP